VRRFGPPVDICEPDAMAAVLYEQWGWPFTAGAWDEITERFDDRPILVDRVDSADFFAHPRGGTVEIASLSKLLGLAGGGLARVNGCFEKFEPQPESAAMRQLRNRSLPELNRAGYQELFKESRQAVHPSVMAWLQRNSLTCAAERERAVRQHHLQLVLNSPLARDWPVWMGDAVRAGTGPVWVPILRGQEAAQTWRVMTTLEKRFGVISARRPFNWSGNPLRPQYEMCLALPIHGGVPELGEILAALV